MVLEKAIEKILEGQAILFVGAGFSYGSKNVMGQVPAAKKLKEDLLKDLKIDNNEYSLEMIANFYKNKKSTDALIKQLKKQFNIISVEKHHKNIVSLPWKRVYTTNYDQVVEMASKESVFRAPVVLSDDFESTSKAMVCIHLNGYIERINAEKINNEFKLTDKSYSCDTLIGNRWFEFMINDFEAASVIFIVGYSMQFDIDIKRLLSAPNISEKVIFIDAPQIDDISKSLLEDYGTCYPIGIQEFCKIIKSVKKEYIPSVNYELKSFKRMYHDTLTSEIPSYEEIVKFYTDGRKNEKLFAKQTTGEYKYIINRRATQLFLEKYNMYKVFVAVSYLGNGKTTFCDIVENELRKKDIKVFRYIHRYDMIDQEIELICNETKKCIVIIDNYPGHIDVLYKFAQYGHHNITFLLTARNSVNMMFRKRLERTLSIDSENIYPLYLNQMNDEEIDDLAVVLENNSLLSSVINNSDNHMEIKNFIRDDCKSSFSDLLLKLFESSNIRLKLAKLYQNLEKMENAQIKEVIIFSLIKNVSNYDISFYEILDLFNADYIAIKKNEIEFIPEIFIQEDDCTINVRSSIISMWLVKEIIKIDDIISTMKKAFWAADNKYGKTYEELQKSMVSHSQFVLFTNVSDQKDKLSMIEDFYDNIRNTKFARHNPFFWEQFASAYIDMKKFDLVKRCIDTAFIEAKRDPGFVPFQIKTVQGRYYVEKCYDDILNGKCDASHTIMAIKDATNAILQFYNHPENNLYYVFKVVRFFAKIYNLVKDSLDKRELSIYVENASIIEKHMDNYLNKTDDSQYFLKVSAWHNELLETLNDAKVLLK